MKFFFIKDKLYLPVILLLYFLCSFFTLSDLSIHNYNKNHSLYPWKYSFFTIFLCLTFILYIFIIFIYNVKSFIPLLLFTLILSAGSFILGFPIFDEIIIFIATISVVINFFYQKKKIKFNLSFENTIFIFLIFFAFIYGITGVSYTLKSIRYIFLYFSILIIFLYSISNLFPKINKKLLINYIYYAVVAYLFMQIVLWGIKFYVFQEYFQTKLFGYLFWGNMQPMNLRSATNYTDIAGIVGTFISLYILRYSNDYIRPLILTFLLFITMCLEDSRSLLLLFYVFSAGLLLTKFNLTKFKFALLAIILCSLLHYSVYKRNFFHKTFDQISNYFTIEYGEKEYNYENSTLLVPKSPDALRQLYLISSIEYVKNKNIESIIGCGLYGYWECNHEIFLLAKKYGIEHFDQPKGNLGTNYLRPTSVSAIIVEFGTGFIFLSFFLLIYCYYKKIKFKSNYFFKNLEMSIFYFYNAIVLIFWTFFGNLEDVSYIYLLMMPNLFFYNLFKK